jgi:integrase
MEQVYLPFYRRKWKGSTTESNEYRLRFHLTSDLAARSMGSFDRDELQALLDRKAAKGLSYSTVAHLRWDLSQIFNMAVAEGYVSRSPATLLFVPREAARPEHRTMTIEEVRKLLSVLEWRERVIAGLAIIAGLRPGEIFGLKRGRLVLRNKSLSRRINDSRQMCNVVTARLDRCYIGNPPTA